MNEEIKEIKINKSNKSITFINNGIAFSQFGIADEILDLITNLQQEINKLTAESTEWESKYYEMQDNFNNANEEIERLKETIKHYENTTTFGDYVKEVNLLIDYKSRCEKAIEFIQNKLKYKDKAIYENDINWLLNILQNGSENQ